MNEEEALPAQDISLRRKELVNIFSNFLVSNREESLLDEWTLTAEVSERLALLLKRNGY